MNYKLAWKASCNSVVNGKFPMFQKEDMQPQETAEEMAEQLP